MYSVQEQILQFYFQSTPLVLFRIKAVNDMSVIIRRPMGAIIEAVEEELQYGHVKTID